MFVVCTSPSRPHTNTPSSFSSPIPELGTSVQSVRAALQERQREAEFAALQQGGDSEQQRLAHLKNLLNDRRAPALVAFTTTTANAPHGNLDTSAGGEGGSPATDRSTLIQAMLQERRVWVFFLFPFGGRAGILWHVVVSSSWGTASCRLLLKSSLTSLSCAVPRKHREIVVPPLQRMAHGNRSITSLGESPPASPAEAPRNPSSTMTACLWQVTLPPKRPSSSCQPTKGS